jgi:GT2 family glycosyltransferase
VEWSLRARRHGCRLHYQPAAEVTHLGQASRAFDAESDARLTLHSTGAFWDLAYAPPAAAALKLALLASIGLSLLKNALLAAFVPRCRARLQHLLTLIAYCFSMLVRPGTGRGEAPASKT